MGTLSFFGRIFICACHKTKIGRNFKNNETTRIFYKTKNIDNIGISIFTNIDIIKKNNEY
jgi:hypothetical protein